MSELDEQPPSSSLQRGVGIGGEIQADEIGDLLRYLTDRASLGADAGAKPRVLGQPGDRPGLSRVPVARALTSPA